MSDVVKVIVLGAGGHGRVIADSLLSAAGHLELAGYADEKLEIGLVVDGAKVLCRDAGLGRIREQGIATHFIVGIGSVKGGGALRAKIFQSAKDAGLKPVSIVHPSAVVSKGAKVASGCAIMAGAVINTGADIGENAIINTRASVDHDTRIGAHVHVAPGAVLSGGVTVEDYCLIGVGAVLMQGIHIGSHATIGAGSTVVRSVASKTTVIGTRARPYAN